MSGHTSRKRTGEGDESASSGFSLSAVLVFMLIVSAIIVPFAVTAKTRLMIANNEVEQERLRLVAEGLGNVVASQLTGDTGTEKFPLDFTQVACRSGELSFGIRVQDHGGLIDLNTADERLLALGFKSLGFEQQTAEELAKAAVQFRDNAGQSSEVFRPRSTAGPAEDKQAPFEFVSELNEFPALVSIPPRTLHAVFTVNSKRGGVLADRAPGPLRAALAGGSGVSVFQTPVDTLAFTVEVVVRRDRSGIAGEAGFIIQKSPATPTTFWRVSRSPAGEAGALPPAIASIGCDGLFGTEAARILQRWAS